MFAFLARLIRQPEWKDLPWAWELKSALLRQTGLKIGDRTILAAGFCCMARDRGEIEIGDDVILGYNNRILAEAPVRLGRFTLCSMDVTFANAGPKPGETPAPLIVGRGCWIGTGAKIVGPLTIGDNAIIGAGAVVIADVPAGAIVAGVPAQILGRRELPERVWNRHGRYFCPRTFEPVKETV